MSALGTFRHIALQANAQEFCLLSEQQRKRSTPSTHVARPEHTPAPLLRSSSENARDAGGRRIGLFRFFMFQECWRSNLLFEVAPHGLGPPIGAGDPGRGTRIDTAVERLIAFAQLLPFEPAETRAWS